MVAGVVGGASLLGATPAMAAPGDASAIGAEAILGVDIPIIGFDLIATVGDVEVLGSGTDSSDEQDYTLVDLALADITVDAVSTDASSDATGSAANAQVAGVDASLLGIDLLSLDTATAAVTCPVGGPATATADVAGLTLLGGLADVDAGEPATATIGLGADVGGEDLSGLDLTVTVTQVETVEPSGSIAISLVALVSINGTAGGENYANAAIATLTLAGATCETPNAVAPVVATGVTPPSGPTTGGQTVTITGSGFTPDTTVTFGATPATGVVVDPAGTSLTAVTPVGAAGPAVVTVAGVGGTATLDYTYVAPAAATITPSSGPEYGGTVVTIDGVGLGTTTGVSFDGVDGTIVSVNQDGTQVIVTTPAGTGTAAVVLTVAGGATVPVDQDFVYVVSTADSVTPNTGPTAGGTTVTIVGTGLAGTTGVLFGDTPGTIVGTPTDTSVVVTTPPGAVGPVDVTVQIPGDDLLIEDGFVYAAAPVIGAVTPGQGPATGGTVIVIDGTGFTPGATTVTICGITIPASQVSVNAAGTRLTFTTPACAAGATTISVAAAGGPSGTVPFRYLPVGSTTAGGGSLANTGVSPALTITPAIAFILVGCALTVVAMRRRRSA